MLSHLPHWVERLRRGPAHHFSQLYNISFKREPTHLLQKGSIVKLPDHQKRFFRRASLFMATARALLLVVEANPTPHPQRSEKPAEVPGRNLPLPHEQEPGQCPKIRPLRGGGFRHLIPDVPQPADRLPGAVPAGRYARRSV